MTVLLSAIAAILFSTGTYLLLQRTLTRIVFGFALIGHGTNLLLLLSAGQGGEPALIGEAPISEMVDPLPQAMALTAIVINFSVVVFLLALAYRSYVLTRADEVEDDREDHRIARLERSMEELESGIDSDADHGGEFVEVDFADDPDRTNLPEDHPTERSGWIPRPSEDDL